MDQIRAGQRIRISSRRLVHSGQRGTVIRADADGGFYVHLDYDHDRPDAETFFYADELEPVQSIPAQINPPLGDDK